MKTARLPSLVLAMGLAVVALIGAAPGKAIKADVSFATTDLSVADETSRKCVKVGKASYIDVVACNCHVGTADITILDNDVSVFPTAGGTATAQATPLAFATGCTGMIVIDIRQSVISETPNYGELCIQATAKGGEAAVNCRFRGSAKAAGNP